MEIKMDKTVLIVSAVVGSLGALSAILGFAAEGEKATNPSPGLGICAALFLLVAQTTVSAVAVVGYCKSRPILSETKQIIVIVCGVVSGILAVIASVLFLFAASLSASNRSGGMNAGAAVLTAAATALGIASFVMLRRQPAGAAPATAGAGGAPTKPAGEQPPPAGIATGQPQFQPAGVAGGQRPSSGYGGKSPNQQSSPPSQGHEQV